ncbi:Uncharacterized protein APZ42_032674 [Daphnia magna]|uniref:Uncharacterized protein n=1 Tax=Daphnia magna TaxID=35525 RepID=A0A164LR20_9CRUS|nr:Uncharacterized protein APZ42_032674 [Daphnia magna]
MALEYKVVEVRGDEQDPRLHFPLTALRETVREVLQCGACVHPSKAISTRGENKSKTKTISSLKVVFNVAETNEFFLKWIIYIVQTIRDTPLLYKNLTSVYLYLSLGPSYFRPPIDGQSHHARK